MLLIFNKTKYVNLVSNVAEIIDRAFFAATLFPISLYMAFLNMAFLTCGMAMEAV
jgi:hypothetical protein